MRSTPATAYLGTLLSLALSACQPISPLDETTRTARSTADAANAYRFAGNPGIATSMRDDITGTMTGTVDGQAITFGPDQATPVVASTSYNRQSLKATTLNISAQNEQYTISLALRGPFEDGRSYRLVSTGQEQESPYTVIAYVRPRVGVSTRQIIDLAPYDKHVRITALTAAYIDLQFDFRLDKPGASPERMTMRVKNVLNENRTVRTQSETAPYWDYTVVSRMIEGCGYNTEALPFNEYGYSPQTTRVFIQQGPLTTSTTQIRYDGQTESVQGQRITLIQPKTPFEQTRIEYDFQTKRTDQSWKWVEIIWPNFKGVGTYSGDNVTLRFTNSQGDAGFWRIHTGKRTTARTNWQVDVQRVTPDVIEGTYTITDAPLYEQAGSLPMPVSASVSGRFQMIYPR